MTDETPKRRGRRPKAGTMMPMEPGETITEAAKRVNANGAPTLASRMAQLQEMGLPESAIMAALNDEFGGGDAPAARPAPTPGAPQGVGELGPDPQMVAAYHERMKTYKAPVLHVALNALEGSDKELGDRIADGLRSAHGKGSTPSIEVYVNCILDAIDGYGGITVRRMFFDWVQQWRAWQSVLRKMPAGQQITEAETIAMIIKHHWHTNGVDRAMLQAAKVGGSMASGPAKHFKEGSAQWQA